MMSSLDKEGDIPEEYAQRPLRPRLRFVQDLRGAEDDERENEVV